MKGEVLVVIGGTKGIGAAVSRLAAQEGASVVFCGRTESAGRALEAEIAKAGGKGTFVQADLMHGDQIRKVIDTAAEVYGKVTVLVTNAAATDSMRVPDTIDLAEADWAEYIRLGLTNACFIPVQQALPHMMKAGHGSIVVISSMTAARGTLGPAPYTAVKAAEAALVRHWALMYAEHNIRANAILPGFVKTGTETMDAILADPEISKAYAVQLLGFGEPEDIAYAVLWLGSRESKWVTGQNLHLEGGATNYIPSAKNMLEIRKRAEKAAAE
jgi:NAD(P)-dependent dehydrogenase (short-subunit alcohol dehydrogenase family)